MAPETKRTRLRLHTTGGAVVERELQRSRMSRPDLFGPEDLRSKFVGNVAPRTENGAAERGLAAAEALYESNSATPFLDWLADRRRFGGNTRVRAAPPGDRGSRTPDGHVAWATRATDGGARSDERVQALTAWAGTPS